MSEQEPEQEPTTYTDGPPTPEEVGHMQDEVEDE